MNSTLTLSAVTLGEALTALALNNGKAGLFCKSGRAQGIGAALSNHNTLFASSAGHILVETALVATILFLLLQRSYKPDKKPLTERASAPVYTSIANLGSRGPISTC